MGASCLSPARSKWCRNPSWARRVHIKRRKWRGGADARSPWRVKNIRAESYVLRDKNTRISPVASVLSSFFELMFYFSFIIRLRYYYHYIKQALYILLQSSGSIKIRERCRARIKWFRNRNIDFNRNQCKLLTMCQAIQTRITDCR